MDVQITEQRAPYVMFERQAIEDRAASISNGRYMTKDVDFAIVTPIGSKDRLPKKVEDWFVVLDQYAREERIPPGWPTQYRAAYDAWKLGLELPLEGIPIKGWAVMSPAQQANVIGANIRTVEDLAQINDEAIRRIGMGGLELRDKAIAWLKSAKATGFSAQEIATLQSKARSLEKIIADQAEKLALLKAENEQLTQGLIKAQKSGNAA